MWWERCSMIYELHGRLFVLKFGGGYTEVLKRHEAHAVPIIRFVVGIAATTAMKPGGVQLKAIAKETIGMLLKEESWATACQQDAELGEKLAALTVVIPCKQTEPESPPPDGSLGMLDLLDQTHRAELQRKVRECCAADMLNVVRSLQARILLIGYTGTGKSSLINTVFAGDGEPIAEAGAGKSVTGQVFHFEPTDQRPVHIYDTQSFGGSIDQIEDCRRQLRDLFRERQDEIEKYEVNDYRCVEASIHVVWWVTGGRYDDKIVKLLREVVTEECKPEDGKTPLPIIAVLNKCDIAGEHLDFVEKQLCECEGLSGVVRVAAHPQQGPINGTCEECGAPDLLWSKRRKRYECENCGHEAGLRRSYGVEELVEETAKCTPDMVLASLWAAEKVWLKDLDKQALTIISYATAWAVAVGAWPLPVNSRWFIFPLQTGMLIKLGRNYGLVISGKAVLSIVTAAGGSVGLGMGGCLAGSVLKCILGPAASVTCGALSGSLTWAIGMVGQELFRRIRSKAVTVEIKDDVKIHEFMRADEMQALIVNSIRRATSQFEDLMKATSSSEDGIHCLRG